MSDRRIAVVGGGLAGLAAALECADGGASVTLFESRPRLGGATFSVERKGVWIDNGQHVALRCCTAYRRFLQRIGVEGRLEVQPRLRIPVIGPDGRTAVLERNALAAPLHLGQALLRYGHLSVRERLAAIRASAALRTLNPEDDRLDRETFGAWLRAHGQSERAISALWNLIALPTINLPADDASLALAVKVFRTGLLDESDACDVALPRVPLQHLHGDPAAAALRARNVRVELGRSVRRVEPTAAGFDLEVADGRTHADAVIVAVPHQAVGRVVPRGVVDTSALARLGSSPIVNVHLHYDRRVLGEPFVACLESPLQWVFDRTEPSGVGRGQLLAISLSGADRELGSTRDGLIAMLRPEVERVLPLARTARLLDAHVTKEPRATFRGAPGTAALRPGPRTALPGLFLAGAWTDTGWPATMEGAVRSGVAAAGAALADRARPERAAGHALGAVA